MARYLPGDFVDRIRPSERGWRGRVVLVMWGAGYPLEMAWWFAMVDDPETNAFHRSVAAAVDDDALATLLDATAPRRHSDRDLAFVSFATDAA